MRPRVLLLWAFGDSLLVSYTQRIYWSLAVDRGTVHFPGCYVLGHYIYYYARYVPEDYGWFEHLSYLTVWVCSQGYSRSFTHAYRAGLGHRNALLHSWLHSQHRGLQ